MLEAGSGIEPLYTDSSLGEVFSRKFPKQLLSCSFS